MFENQEIIFILCAIVLCVFLGTMLTACGPAQHSIMDSVQHQYRNDTVVSLPGHDNIFLVKTQDSIILVTTSQYRGEDPVVSRVKMFSLETCDCE